MRPSDTVEIRNVFNDIVFDGLSKGKKFLNEILTLDQRVPSFKLKMHHQDIDAFNRSVDSVYRTNIHKINNAYQKKELTSTEQKDFLDFNELFAATEYLSPLTMNATDRDKVDLTKLNFQFAKDRLQLATSISSHLVPVYVSGLVSHEALDRKVNLTSSSHFALVQKDVLGDLYYPYLLKLITQYPQKNESTFRTLLDSLSRNTANSPFVFAVDSLKNVYFTRPDQRPSGDFGQLQDLEGTDTNFTQLLQASKGEVVLLDFWASWCGPCRREMPLVHEIRKRFNGKPIRFITISIDNDDYVGDWKTAARSEKLDSDNCFRLKKGQYNSLLKHYGIDAVPRYMVFDKEGRLISDRFVEPTHKSFEVKLQTYLDE